MPGPAAADLPPFAALKARMVTLGAGGERLAVHLAGQLGGGRLPLVCIPGYQRNMLDFTDFVPLLQQQTQREQPVVLLDLRGRGRSASRRRAADYTSVADAHDVARAMRALGIERAVFVGQGHGGQVIMALAAESPLQIAGTVLIDAGPVTPPESLVRLRGNCEAIAGLRGAGGLTVMLRRMLGSDYPGRSAEELDRLAARTHTIDPGGRAIPLFDPALIARLKGLAPDDVLVPQWQLFSLLGWAPLLVMRTEHTDQLPLPVLEEMLRRRPDAEYSALPGQGSPALLDQAAEAATIAAFVRQINGRG